MASGPGQLQIDQAEEDELTHITFAREHRVNLHSANPLERLNGEIKRCTNVIGIFSNNAAITRRIGAIPREQNDEWVVQRARYMTLDIIAPLSDDTIVTRSSTVA